MEKANEIINSMLEQLVTLQTILDGRDDGVKDKPVEMLSIPECAALVEGISTHMVRQLVLQGKIKAVRTGTGKRSKYLVNKADFLHYFQK